MDVHCGSMFSRILPLNRDGPRVNCIQLQWKFYREDSSGFVSRYPKIRQITFPMTAQKCRICYIFRCIQILDIVDHIPLRITHISPFSGWSFHVWSIIRSSKVAGKSGSCSERPFWLIHLRRDRLSESEDMAMSQQKLLNGCLFPPNIDLDPSPFLSTRLGWSWK